MAVLSLQDVSISFGGPQLLENISMQVEKSERVCLLGRNGEGKTTLLKIISNEVEPDNGAVITTNGTTISGLSQELPPGIRGPIYDVVAGGLGRIGLLLEEYRKLTNQISAKPDKSLVNRMDILQTQLEAEVCPFC